MSFLWPQALWILSAVPALVGVYLWLLRRRKMAALRFASLALVREAQGPSRQFRRHVPPILFLLAIVATMLAIARPSAVITLPTEQRTIILAIDVSLSMRAKDVPPSRIVAAQEAAKAFVQEQPPDVRIGIVTFAGSASVVQAPTRNRDELVAAIDRFELQRHTAIGSGIILSLATLFPDAGIDVEPATRNSFSPSDRTRAAPLEQAGKNEKKLERKAFTPVPPASNPNTAIILLTDGRRTTGPDPQEAAKMAADRGVRVYTVGFGTAAGAPVDFDGMSIFMRFDEEALRTIARITQAEYFHAGSLADLKKIYETLNSRVVLERKETEISALFAAAAATLAVAAALLSLLWFHRIG